MIDAEAVGEILAKVFQENLNNRITPALGNGMVGEILTSYRLQMSKEEAKISSQDEMEFEENGTA